MTPEVTAQLAMSHVHRVHATGSTVDQDAGESAGRRAQVHADAVLDVDPEAVQGGG